MKQNIVVRCAVAAGALAGVVAISACTPTTSGAPAPSGANTATNTAATQPQVGQPVTTSANTAATTVSAPAHIYYPTCQGAGQDGKSKIEPADLVFSCDATLSLENAQWTAWNSSYAEGTATLSENDCTPSCANGTDHKNKVEVRFDKPVKLSCGEFWSDVVFTYVGKPVGVPANAKQTWTFNPGQPSSYC